MWMRPDIMTGKHQIIGKWGESSNQEYRFFIGAGTLRFDLRDQSSNGMASVFTSDLDPATLQGSWHHVAITYNGQGGATQPTASRSTSTASREDSSASTMRRTCAMENGTAPLEIGREGPSWNMYDGGLDDVRMWNVARSASAIQAAMNAELLGTEPGLVAYWRFNEGAGTSVGDDSPGTSVGTLLNGVAWGRRWDRWRRTRHRPTSPTCRFRR
jgi:hypothetical protein